MNFNMHFPIGVLQHDVDPILADSVEKTLTSYIDNLEKGPQQYNDYYSNNRADIPTLCPELYDEIIKLRNEYTMHSGHAVTDDIQFWIQDYRTQNDYHETHNHGVSGLSGVYWVRANEQAGNLRFYNPNPFVNHISKDNSKSPLLSPAAEYKPTKGQLLLFPSFLQHKVCKSMTGVKRTTIAFNIMPPSTD